MYDPTIGRFLTEDPIGTADDVNEYRYVKNNPTDATDPTGLYEADNRYTKDTIKLVNVDDVLNRLVNLTIIRRALHKWRLYPSCSKYTDHQKRLMHTRQRCCEKKWSRRYSTHLDKTSPEQE